MRLMVNVKHLGKRKNTIDTIPYEVEKKPETISDLIEEVVKVCVREYKSRQENAELLQVLFKKEIEDKAAGGKLSFGKNYGTGTPELNAAIANAKQAFLDGIVVIFIDGREQASLEEKADISEESSITFVRMTMLSGRLW